MRGFGGGGRKKECDFGPGMFNTQVWGPGLFFSEGLLKSCGVTATSTSQAISRELWEERFFQKVLETWPDERCRGQQPLPPLVC